MSPIGLRKLGGSTQIAFWGLPAIVVAPPVHASAHSVDVAHNQPDLGIRSLSVTHTVLAILEFAILLFQG